MAVNQRNVKNARKVNNVQNTYVYGNTVRKLQVAEPYRVPSRNLQKVVRKQAKTHATMSVFHMLVMLAALAVCAVILVNYIQLQADLTNTIRNVAVLENQVNDLRLENEDTYHRIMNGVDLEEIKRIAIGELGMTYASDGQIITYAPAENDYMREVID